MSKKKRNRDNRPRRSAPPAKAGAARPSLALRPVAAYGRWLVASVGAALVIGGVLLYFWLGTRRPMPPAPSAGITTPVPAAVSPPAARFVGGQACVACHMQEYEAWRASHHAMAMQEANAQTVLGDFGDARFTEAGVTSAFFTRDGRFYVNTDGPDGEPHDYKITYTFGVEPLQQYLVEFPGGRLQALSIAWDTRPKEAGGQRWFHLYAGEALRAPDPLHWTGREQTWNYQCAECHSTDLHKNYNIGQNRYATTWSEMMVSCEACHGPGSAHVAWAQARPVGAPRAPAGTTGLKVPLGRSDGNWVMQDSHRGIAEWRGPARSTAELDVCARCHARRRPIVAPYPYGRPLLDTHMPVLLEAGLYHADGQILDEVYEYGSFIQSRMFRAGVTCSDCHEPHGLGLQAPGNAVCAQCHMPARFDTPAHHHHNIDSDAARCVSCHMPARTYMVVDPRRDHSLRIPRPDLSVALGTPNACTGCHQDQPPAWAADAVVRWYGPGPRPPHFVAALHAGRTRQPGAEGALARLLGDAAMPGIARATAVSLLGQYRSPQALRAVKRALTDADPLVRMAAAAGIEAVAPHTRLRLGAPLLQDAMRAVRIEAARVLAPLDKASMTAEQRAALDRALVEYRQAQEVNADRPEAHLNLGILQAQLGKPMEAEQAYRTALRIDPSFVPTYVNLADLYRAQEQDEAGEHILRQGLAVSPNDAALHHALGLLLVRRGQLSEALGALGRAAELGPETPRYGYVFGVALHSAHQSTRALEILKQTHARHPGEPEILVGLATINRERGQLDTAIGYARKLVELVPYDQGARELLATLEAQRR